MQPYFYIYLFIRYLLVMYLKLLKFLSEEISEQGYGMLHKGFTGLDNDVQGFNIQTGQKVEKGWSNKLISGMDPKGYDENKSNDFVTILKKLIGKKYGSGKSGPNEFDSSGLVVYFYKKLGYTLTQKTCSKQYDASEKIFNTKNLLPGDLIFFDIDAGGRGSSAGLDHVGIVISPLGSEKIDMVHSEKGSVVSILYDVTNDGTYSKLIFGYGRYPIYKK